MRLTFIFDVNLCCYEANNYLDTHGFYDLDFCRTNSHTGKICTYECRNDRKSVQ